MEFFIPAFTCKLQVLPPRDYSATFPWRYFFNGTRNIARFPGNQKSVSTILDTPTGYPVPNGFLKAYQISTKSAHPLPSYSKRVFFRHPICGARHVLQLSLTLLSTILIDRRGEGATHQRRPHANRTYGSRVISFSIMLLASVLMVFMASRNRTLTHCSHLVGNRALLGRKLYF